MKFLGLLTVSVMLWSSHLFAAPTQAEVNQLNKNISIDQMQSNLKDFFTTSEDHRLIENNFETIRNSVQGWHWRVELAGDKMAFRVNGKIQVYLQDDPNRPGVYFLNGKEISLVRGQSYRSYVQQVEKIFKSTNVKLENLFIQEASAFVFPLFVGLVGGLAICNHNCKNGKCGKGNKGNKGNKAPQGGKGQPTIASYEPVETKCRLRARRNDRRIPFDSTQMLRSWQRWKGDRCKQTGKVRGRTVPYNTNGCFHNFESCYHWKTEEGSDKRWGKPKSKMEAVCNELVRYNRCKNGVTVVVEQGPKCTPGGKGKGGCENSVPQGACNKSASQKEATINEAYNNPGGPAYGQACACGWLECGGSSGGVKGSKSNK